MTTNRLAKSSGEKSPLNPHECAAWANDRLTPEQAAIFEYAVFDGKLAHRYLKPLPESAPRNVMDRRGERMSVADTNKLNAMLESYGATVRYNPDGSKYAVEAQAA